MKSTVFLLSVDECEIFYAYEYENANLSWHFHIYEQRKLYAMVSYKILLISKTYPNVIISMNYHLDIPNSKGVTSKNRLKIYHKNSKN